MFELRELYQGVLSRRSSGQNDDYYQREYARFLCFVSSNPDWLKETIINQETRDQFVGVMRVFLQKIPQEKILDHECSGIFPQFFSQHKNTLKKLSEHYAIILAYLPKSNDKTEGVVRDILKDIVGNPDALDMEVTTNQEKHVLAEMLLSLLKDKTRVISSVFTIRDLAKNSDWFLNRKDVNSDSFSLAYCLVVRVLEFAGKGDKLALEFYKGIISFIENVDPELLIKQHRYKGKETTLLEEMFLSLNGCDLSLAGEVQASLLRIAASHSTIKEFLFESRSNSRPPIFASFISRNKNVTKKAVTEGILKFLGGKNSAMFQDFYFKGKTVNYANLLSQSAMENPSWWDLDTNVDIAGALFDLANKSAFGVGALYRNYYQDFGPLPAIFVVNHLPGRLRNLEGLDYFLNHGNQQVFCMKHGKCKSMVEVFTDTYSRIADRQKVHDRAVEVLVEVLGRFKSEEEQKVQKVADPILIVAKNVLGCFRIDKALLETLIRATGDNINFISLMYQEIFRNYPLHAPDSYSFRFLSRIVQENPRAISAYCVLYQYQNVRKDIIKADPSNKKKLTDGGIQKLLPVATLFIELFHQRPRELLEAKLVRTETHFLSSAYEEYYAGTLQHILEDLFGTSVSYKISNFLILGNLDNPRHLKSTFKKIFDDRELMQRLVRDEGLAKVMHLSISLICSHYLDEIKAIDIFEDKANLFFRALNEVVTELKGNDDNAYISFWSAFLEKANALVEDGEYFRTSVVRTPNLEFVYQLREQIRLELVDKEPARNYRLEESKSVISILDILNDLTGEKQRLMALSLLTLANLVNGEGGALEDNRTTDKDGLLLKVRDLSLAFDAKKFSEEEFLVLCSRLEKIEEIFRLVKKDQISDFELNHHITGMTDFYPSTIRSVLYVDMREGNHDFSGIEMHETQASSDMIVPQREVKLERPIGLLDYIAGADDKECDRFVNVIKASDSLETRYKACAPYRKDRVDTSTDICM